MSLITKLDSCVTDTSILQLGALRLKSKVVENPEGPNRVFGIRGPWSAKIIGDPLVCYFTDETLTQNNGQEITFTSAGFHYVWVSNAECEILVKPKYGISGFSMSSEGVYFDGETFDDIGIIPDCTSISIKSTSSAGDVAKLSGLYSLVSLTGNTDSAIQDGITGNLDKLKNLPLENISLPRTAIKATLEKLAEFHSLNKLDIYFVEDVEGSVDAFADNSQFTSFRIGALRNGRNLKITGNITSLGKMVDATYIGVPFSGVTGTCDDLAAALASNGKTSGLVRIQSADGTIKDFTFPLT